jgi:hypothetical protein
MKHLRQLFALVLALAAVSPAFAADPVYPPGSRIGIVPIEGLVVSKTFRGFETEDHTVKVPIAELPAAAYGDVQSAFRTNSPPAGASAVSKPESLQTAAGEAYYTVETAKDGNETVRRFSLLISGGSFSGYVGAQIPETAANRFSEDAVRQMFASTTVRNDVPLDEQLGLMPFKVTELGGFKSVRVLAPGTILLSDVEDATGVESAPYMVIASVSSGPAQPEDRGRFAQQAVRLIPGMREGRITMSEPIRIAGSPGYETRVEGTGGKDNTPVTAVQWLRFGSGSNVLRIIASTPRDEWSKAFSRFRAVRDGIQPR